MILNFYTFSAGTSLRKRPNPIPEIRRVRWPYLKCDEILKGALHQSLAVFTLQAWAESCWRWQNIRFLCWRNSFVWLLCTCCTVEGFSFLKRIFPTLGCETAAAAVVDIIGFAPAYCHLWEAGLSWFVKLHVKLLFLAIRLADRSQMPSSPVTFLPETPGFR